MKKNIIVFKGGSIYTADKAQSRAEAVIVEGDTIAYVGDEAGAEAWLNGRGMTGTDIAVPGAEPPAGETADLQIVDLKGKTLLPSFFEGHCHYAAATNAEVGVDLAGMHTEEEYVAACKAYLKKHPGTTILRGQGYLEACFPGQGPRREALDEVSRDIPIVLLPETLHSLWANTKAIEMAGVTDETPDPPGGRIERDENGRVSGCFRELAQHVILDAIPEMSVEEYKQGILAYQEKAHALGFNGSYDAWTDDVGRNAILALRELDEEGKLTMRFRASYWMDPRKGPEQLDAIIAQRREDDPLSASQADAGRVGQSEGAGTSGDACPGSTPREPLFRINSVKFFLDGILESYTGFFLEPYVHCPGYPKGWRGEPIWDDDNLRAVMQKADENGFNMHFHTYCDGAVRQALDAIEYVQGVNGKKDLRPALTHIFYIDPSDIPRFKELGAIPMLNSYWCQIDETYVLNGHNIGEERESHSFAMGSFFKAGARVGNASDYPITAVPDPFVGIEMGITRTAPDNYHPWIFDWEDPAYHRPLWPEERCGLEDMIDSFTINNAYADFIEDISGSIEPGKKADLVVADRDIFETAPEDIGLIKVEKTYFGGRIVYEKK